LHSIVAHSLEWLGHIALTRKIVSEMTYIVSSGTLNPTIPYYTIPWPKSCLVRGLLAAWQFPLNWVNSCNG